MVELAMPTPKWVNDFQALGDELRASLRSSIVVGLDHIGSTAVPQLPAKDVIDVQIRLADLTAVKAAFVALSAATFEPRDYTRDDIKPGWPADPDQWVKRFVQQRPGDRAANIHLRIDGHANASFAVKFRDRLISDMVFRDHYLAIKRRLAVDHEDTQGYALAKDIAIDELLVKIPL